MTCIPFAHARPSRAAASTPSERALARAPPSPLHPRTPQPRRGFHPLRKGFSPHFKPASTCASASRPRTPQPRRGFHVLRKGFSPHFIARKNCGKGVAPHARIAARASCRDRRQNSVGGRRDRRAAALPHVVQALRAGSTKHPFGRGQVMGAIAPQGLPRPQGGLQPAHLAPPPTHPSPAGASTPSERASARTPPTCPSTHTPQPRRGFYVLRKGFSPHFKPASTRASPSTHTPQPRRGFHVLRKGFSPHTFLPRPQGGLPPAL